MLLFNIEGRARDAGAAAVATVRSVLDPEQALPALTIDLNAAEVSGSADVSSAVATFLQDGVRRSKARTAAVRSLPQEVRDLSRPSHCMQLHLLLMCRPLFRAFLANATLQGPVRGRDGVPQHSDGRRNSHNEAAEATGAGAGELRLVRL